MDRASPTGQPVTDLVRIMMRTLTVLYISFWASIVIYTAVLLAVPSFSASSSSRSGFLQPLPENWGQWEFLLGALGVVTVYVSHRLRARLLDPERIRRGAANVYELAARLHPRDADAPSGGDDLVRAVQDLLGRTVSRYTILWVLADVPAVLGLLAAMISGSPRLFLALGLISALALFVHRPTRERLEAILGPMAD